MIEPKVYKVKDDISHSLLIENEFVNKPDYYYLKKSVYYEKPYGDMIFVHLFIYKEDKWLVVKVLDHNGNIYAPFDNPELRHNNRVSDIVIKNYNKYMDSLKTKNIFEEVEDNFMCTEKDAKSIMIKYHADIKKLTNVEGDKSDWIDLRVAEDIFIPKGESKLISLGVSMKLPDGHEAHIVPRSSTFKNYGIIQTNHCGIIDNSYSGTNDIWKFPAYCLVPKDIINGKPGTLLHKNDRICQFRIVEKQSPVIFEEVDKLGDEDRGGFGSTGKR